MKTVFDGIPVDGMQVVENKQERVVESGLQLSQGPLHRGPFAEVGPHGVADGRAQMSQEGRDLVEPGVQCQPGERTVMSLRDIREKCRLARAGRRDDQRQPVACGVAQHVGQTRSADTAQRRSAYPRGHDRVEVCVPHYSAFRLT